MGAETSEWYNNFCLIGHTNERGKAWHYQEAMQGDEPNHYPGGIPYADVVRRLFSWKPMITRTANLVACKPGMRPDAYIPRLDAFGEPLVDSKGKPKMVGVKIVEVPNMRGIVRDDNYLELGRNTTRYRIHDYEEWLLKLQSNLIGDTLDIWSAILLRNGAQACIQVALPETVQDDKTGMEFVPYLHAYTSLDGSLSTTFAAQTLLIVCDNTMAVANRRAEATGRQYKAKHTEASLSEDRVQEARQALSLIHQSADESIEFFHTLGAIKVPDKKWVEVMDIIIPEGSDDDNKQTVSRRSNKRELLNATYHTDPMGCTWKGTALGVLQAVNTYATHYAPIRGATRTQRNATRIVNGDFARADMKVLQALADVLDKPELVGLVSN